MRSFETEPNSERIQEEACDIVEGFEPEKILANERGILDRFKGKAGKAVDVLMLVSAMAFLSEVVTKEAYAGQKEGGTKIERIEKKTQEEKDIDFLFRLYNIPDDPKAINEDHKNALKRADASRLIHQYVLERKGLYSGKTSYPEFRDTLEALRGAINSPLFEKKILGREDISIEDLQKLQQLVENNPGLRTLMDLFSHYHKLPETPAK